ncbi:MAG: glycerol-3-phosphate dehydrogenase [Planctomycetaceae bacterium]|nr:glycerol-3-phosphate dehydrogenase [Planctomycetaceae bacterium]
MSTKRITVIGDGAMATVCAMLLDSQGHRVTLWGPFADHIGQMASTRRNDRYLPGTPLPQSLQFSADDDEVMRDAELVVSATPTQFKRRVWGRLAGGISAGVPVVSVAKGVENDTLLRPTQIIDEVLSAAGKKDHALAALCGPTIARELERHLPATVCVATSDDGFAQALQEAFTTTWFRVYTHDDLVGVELAAATKNVIALAAGILDGLQAGNNAKSALLSRGLAEITRLGVAMGARQETFFGIAGVGDLATTCFSPEGRNRSAGEMLGKGQKLDAVLEEIQGVVEGVPTTRSVMQLAQQTDVEMPITAAVNAVLFEGLDPIEGIAMLMQRQPKAERVG